jgi:hypothetical protein
MMVKVSLDLVNCNGAAGLGDVSEGNAKVYQLKKET